MPKFEKLEEANAAYEKLDSELGEVKKHISTLNAENATHRKHASDLEGELERVKRAGESEAEKKARETVGKEYEARMEALKAEYYKDAEGLKGQLRRLNLEGAAVKAGLKPDVVADAIRLLPEGTDDAKAETAFREIGKKYPGMLVNQGGGPQDGPGSRGGGGLPAGEIMPKTLRELTHDANGRATPERAAAFMRDHPEDYARLTAGLVRRFHGGAISELAPVTRGETPKK